MFEILSHPFMQRALIAAALSGLLAPAVGMYIVQRRLSLLGDGLGHVAIVGIGLALLTGAAPLPVAAAVCILGALTVEWLRQSGKASSDTGLAILFYGGLAGGILLAGLAGRGTAALSQYLFGSLLTVTPTDIWLLGVLTAFGVGISLALAPQFFSVCADEGYARTQGLPVGLLNTLMIVSAALTVTVSLRTVGVLLVSALMVVPVAAASNLLTGFRATLSGAIVLGLLVSTSGTVVSALADTPSGATIVVLAIAVFLLSSLIGRRRRRVPLSDPELPTLHAHIPAEPHADAALAMDTEAVAAVLHGDHVDYLHGGHRHAPHGDHFDEH
ncbi:MAG: metal ABC transporter permease [Propionibacteriaceae bacterium]|jgi:zinc transport system permease protein|nr:metal ABC transporter permease [Propionibacteriaceae bacterium]